MVSEGLKQLEERAEMIQDKDAGQSDEQVDEPVDEPRAGEIAAAGADMGE